MLMIFLCYTAIASMERNNYGDSSDLFPPVDSNSPIKEVVNFLSGTLGDHMVLQRAPQQAIVWGHTTASATVTTVFNGKTLTTKADVNGTWRQVLPATPASKKAYTLTFKSTSGETASLKDVLFGDVFICGGQSNMQFAMGAITNVSVERELANNYPTIRLFTVGQKTASKTPLSDLQTIEQNWSVASNTTIVGGGGFGWFSAVCWIFGRQISDSLSPTGDIPIGLISNNWGGTPVERWSTPAAYKACNRTGTGDLYNAMINPYTIGPMAVSGFTWYQGEANTRGQVAADQYACLFPAMISGWRTKFNNPSAYFGFVQLSTWCPGGVQDVPEMRVAQMAALKLPQVGYSTNADHGAGCNIHPPPKQYCGERLGNSALALHYKKPIAWRSPSYKSATVSVSTNAITVTVTLNDVSGSGLTTDIYPANYLDGKFNCTAQNIKTPGTCAWGAIEVSGSGWVNASAVASGRNLLLQTTVSTIDINAASVVASAYGWGPIPLMNAYDKSTNLPVLPWNQTL